MRLESTQYNGKNTGIGSGKTEEVIHSEIKMTPLWSGNNNTYYISLQDLESNSLYIIKMLVICIKSKIKDIIKINVMLIAILKSRQHNSWMNYWWSCKISVKKIWH